MNQNLTSWSVFQILCRVLSGNDKLSLATGAPPEILPLLYDMAHTLNLLPALSVRYYEQIDRNHKAGNIIEEQLKKVLIDNTQRNMQIIVQTVELTRYLNAVGIVPLIMKGTIQLLTNKEHNIGFRKQIDIDILIKPGEIETASNVLLSHGYNFYQLSQASLPEFTLLRDTEAAIKAGHNHHHLPPLAKAGFASTVELHSHFLPKRFQKKVQLEPIFRSAYTQTIREAKFLIPSVEYRLIHLILGNVVHDSHLARHTFPIREGYDYLLMLDSANDEIDIELVVKHCGRSIAIFAALTNELMIDTAPINFNQQSDISLRIEIMKKRYNIPTIGKTLDIYAKIQHLILSLIYNPTKLPTYLHRLTTR